MNLRLVQVLRGFTEGARFNWLHPSHGPLPDFAGIYIDGDDQFEVLSWDTDINWVAAVCGPRQYHGGYPLSYRWWKDDGKNIWCRPNKGDVYDVELTDGINHPVRQVAVASIHVHVMTEPWPQGWMKNPCSAK